MTISAVEQCAGRTNFNTVAALRAIEPAQISAHNRVRAATASSNGVFAHPLVAYASASLTKNAALRIVCDHRREISFSVVVLLFSKAFLEASPVEGHLLEFTFASPIADGTIQWVVREKKFGHTTLGFFDLLALRCHCHTVGTGDGAGRLKLRHLFDPHEAHST